MSELGTNKNQYSFVVEGGVYWRVRAHTLADQLETCHFSALERVYHTGVQQRE
jgi:hypothetical protein